MSEHSASYSFFVFIALTAALLSIFLSFNVCLSICARAEFPSTPSVTTNMDAITNFHCLHGNSVELKKTNLQSILHPPLPPLFIVSKNKKDRYANAMPRASTWSSDSSMCYHSDLQEFGACESLSPQPHHHHHDHTSITCCTTCYQLSTIACY